MHQLQQIPGRTAKIQGQEYLYFSGTDYLGIGHLPEFHLFLDEGIKKHGLNFGGSRLSNVRFDVFEKAESALAQTGQAEAALTVSSGTLAGQLVAKHFEAEATLHYAPESHPAMRSAIGNTYTSREAWKAALQKRSFQSGPPIVAFTDGVDSLKVRFFDFEWLHSLGNKRKIILVIDDSHTWGITGKNGGASHTLLSPPEQVELIILGSLGKAYGIPAGFILGKKTRIQSLWQSPFFGGASPTLPSFLYAMEKSQHLYEQQRAHLFRNIHHFQTQIGHSQPFSHQPDYPVFLTSSNALAPYLLDHHVLISSFPYPTPNSAPITRIVINALHTMEDIAKLATLVQDFFASNHPL